MKGLVCLMALVVLGRSARGEVPVDEEYPTFRTGTTLGLPASMNSGALTAGASSNSGINLDALVKAGFKLSRRYARIFFLSESTQLPVASLSQIDMSATSPIETDTFFGALGVKLSFGSQAIDLDAHNTCCAAYGSGATLNEAQLEACRRVEITPANAATVCNAPVPQPSRFFWGFGLRVLAPRAGKAGNIGGAADLYGQVRTKHVDAFLSASGIALQGWTDEVDAMTGSAIKHASVLQANAAFGMKYSYNNIHLGVLGRLGCQQWELDATKRKACSFDAGGHFTLTNLTSRLNELRLYLGLERVTGADRLVAAGVQEGELSIVVRLEPALTSLLK